MQRNFYVVLLLSLLSAGCGGGSSSDSDSLSGSGSKQNTETETGGEAYKCTATAASQDSFIDDFIENNTADRDWGIGRSLAFQFMAENLSVTDIAEQYNAARALDPTINEKLKMPTQSTWNNMSSAEKALYLVNSERCARGIMPLEGIAPNLLDSASIYAAELASTRVLTHGPAGSITTRMSAAGVDTGSGGNADFVSQNESLGRHQVSIDGSVYLTQYGVEARAVYDWLYDDINDGASGYGHRTHVLLKDYTENSGESTSEGLFGFAINVINFDYSAGGINYKSTESWSVMHSFDPSNSYNMAAVTQAPDLFGPESQLDCLAGSYIASQDSDGYNNSVCD